MSMNSLIVAGQGIRRSADRRRERPALATGRICPYPRIPCLRELWEIELAISGGVESEWCDSGHRCEPHLVGTGNEDGPKSQIPDAL